MNAVPAKRNDATEGKGGSGGWAEEEEGGEGRKRGREERWDMLTKSADKTDKTSTSTLGRSGSATSGRLCFLKRGERERVLGRRGGGRRCNWDLRSTKAKRACQRSEVNGTKERGRRKEAATYPTRRASSPSTAPSARMSLDRGVPLRPNRMDLPASPREKRDPRKPRRRVSSVFLRIRRRDTKRRRRLLQ